MKFCHTILLFSFLILSAGPLRAASGQMNTAPIIDAPADNSSSSQANLNFPLSLNSPDGVVLQSGQSGLDATKALQIPGIQQSMLNGDEIGNIGGWQQGNVYTINEGNTRMTAALQIYNNTGDSSHVFNLLDNGNFVNKPPPVVTYPMTR